MAVGMADCDILHLSDLHFTEGSAHAWNREVPGLPSYDQPDLLNTLVRDVDHLSVRPHMVIVSGDLVDKGAEAGVPSAIAFLNDLLKALQLARERLLFVPGNHDVLRSGSNRYLRYDEVYRGVFGSAPFASGTEPQHRVETRIYEELGVEVVGFNTCEQASETDYEGAISQAQRDHARALLRDGDHLRVAVMHHHVAPPQGQVQRDLSLMKDPTGTRAWLVENRFGLVLHGHQHVDFRSVHFDDGWYQSVVGGASAGVGDYGRSAWNLPLGYHVVRVRGHHGERLRRHYDVGTRTWSNGSNGDDHRELRFGRPPVPRRAELRAALRSLPIDSFDGLLTDYFEQAREQVSGDMTREKKINVLFTYHTAAEIGEALRNDGHMP